MSNTLRPVTLVPIIECSISSMLPEATEQPSTYTIGAETSASPFDRLGAFADYVGDLSTYSVIIAQIKTGNAIQSAKNYLQLEGGKLVVRTYLTALAIMGGSLATFLESGAAYADEGPQYTVANTAVGGVYSRNTPNSEDTSETAGVGIYPGDNLTLRCGVTDGSPVGPYNDHTWYYVHDNSRSEPDFWANDHYVQSPNVADQLAPGVTTCPNESSDPYGQSGQESGEHLPCTSMFFIGARGSGELYTDAEHGMGSTVAPVADTISQYYGPSQVTEYGLPYPAVPVVPLKNVGDPYEQSTGIGRAMLGSIIRTQIASCPNQTIELGGYSQGAQVVGDVVSSLNSDERAHIGGIVLFGDPLFNPSNAEDVGTYDHNLGGTFGKRNEVPSDIEGRIMSICNSGDGICNYSDVNAARLGLSSSPHYHYMDTSDDTAAQFLEFLRPTDFVGGIA